MKTNTILLLAVIANALGSLPNATVAAEKRATSAAELGRTSGFVVGCSAYTFRQGTAFEAIDKTKACGGTIIELYTWQKLSPETGNVELNVNLSDEHMKLLKAKLDAAGVKAVNAYVGNANFVAGSQDEKKPRQVFEFARKLGLRGLTGEPPEDQLDIIEKLAREYDIQFCIHNHRKEAAKPEYRNWDPAYVLSLVKNRDPRMGASVDTGHLVRSGIKPVDAIKTLGNRVLSVHLKDTKDWSPEAIDVPCGQGVADAKGILAELKQQGFKGHIAIEYENTTDHLMDDVKQCINFVRVEGDNLPVPQKKPAKSKAR